MRWNRRWAVFLSGRGSNASALFEMLPEIDIVLCVSSKSNAQGICRARREGIPVFILEKNPNWSELHQILKKQGVTDIFLLGFMKLLPASFVDLWKKRILNLHPSLLPLFPGKDSIEESFSAGGPMGVTVHEVTAEMDAGPRILQFQTRKKGTTQSVDLSEVQMEISRAEQRLVRKAVQ